MIIRDFGYMTLPGTPLQPTAVLEEVRTFSKHARGVYKPFLQHLRDELRYKDDEDLFLFAYDWRLDCRYSAFKLEVFIHEKFKQLKDQSARFVIVAHSMGGLVARYCVQKLGIEEKVSAIVTAGTPHNGSADALRTLLRGARVFPFGWRRRASIPAVRSFPSMYQLLPPHRGYLIDGANKSLPIKDMGLWNWLEQDHKEHLRQAYLFHDELASSSSPVPVYSICGVGQNTLRGIQVRRWGTTYNWDHPRWLDKSRGDGVTLYDSASHTEDLTREVNRPHAQLLDDPSAHEYIGNIVRGKGDSVRSRGARRMPYLGAWFVGPSSVYDVGNDALLFIGLHDANNKIVRGTRFRVELHGPAGTFKIRSLGEFWEAGTQKVGQVVMVTFKAPDEPGEYFARVTLSHADDIVLAPAFVDRFFKVYPAR